MNAENTEMLPTSREELLKVAAARAGSAPVQLTIRQLLGYWDAKRRGYWITEEIKHDLTEAKLATHPDFAEGWIDSSIELVPIKSPSAQSDAQTPIVSDSVANPTQVSLRVISLASANSKVEFVPPDATLERAQTLMICNDYSQLAVQSGLRDLRGAVSWESIAQAKIRKPDAELRDAIVQPEVVGLHDDLLARIPMIVEAGFVFVQAVDKQICGIITTADLSLEFAALAKPFFLLAEVERRLRRLIDRKFSPAEIAAVVDPADTERSAASAGDLTIGEAARLLESPANWNRLGWVLDRSIFIKQLHDIRQIRNEVMHFSPDPLDDDQIRRIELFLRSLRKLDPNGTETPQQRERRWSGACGRAAKCSRAELPALQCPVACKSLETTEEVALPFRVRYNISGFPPGIATRNGDLSFDESELVHGLFTAGRAPGDQLVYGDASVWELLHRASFVRAYIRSNYDQRLTLSRLARDLDRSERAAVLYAIGQAMTCIFSRQVLAVQYLMHIERYASRWAISFGNRKRPDLFGRSPQGWIVAEAKGRSSAPDTTLRSRIRDQKSSVTSIQGQNPSLAIGVISYFATQESWTRSQEPWLRIEVIDPESDPEGIDLEIDIDRFILTYYEPFLTAIDVGERDGEQRPPSATSDGDVVSVRFDPFNLRIGLLRSIDTLVRRAKSSGDLTGLSQFVTQTLAEVGRSSLFTDGTLVEAQWSDSISTDDWLY